MKSFYLLIIFCFLFGTSFAFSQDDDSLSTKKKYYLAVEKIDKGKFKEAIPLYLSLLETDEDNPVLNFLTGYCYLNTASDKSKAAKYLSKSVDPDLTENAEVSKYLESATGLKETPDEALFFLGKAYHINYKFQDAIDTYNELLPKIDPENVVLKEDIQHRIEMCEYAKKAMKAKEEREITNLKAVNSEYADHSPVISADEKTLIFTSRREGGTGEESASDGKLYEDVYISTNEDGVWSEPKNIGNSINTEAHDATIGLSADGNILYVYRDDNGDGNIYESKRSSSGTWSKAKKMPRPINTKARETHASISHDGTELYFTSDRTKGEEGVDYFGGMDIYVSKKLPSGEWGDPVNLGSSINTKYDEEGPFVHPKGELYFSSNGHQSMGGLDVLVSYPDADGKFQKPTNLGAPINTPDDDVFFVVSANNQRAYYASRQNMKDSKGSIDIYYTVFEPENITNMAAYTGNVKTCGEYKDVKITVVDKEKDELIGVYRPDSKTGKYVIILPPDKKYDITYEAEGCLTQNNPLETKPDETYDNSRVVNEIPEVELLKPDVVVATGDEFIVQNINFGFDKSKNPDVYDDLTKFAKYLIENPGAVIEISGYCCQMGDDNYNVYLSKRRTEFVYNFLVKKGVPKTTFEVKYHGEKHPIALNKTSDGNWIPQSMKFNRRVEFKVVKPGETNIRIQQLNVPENFRIK